MLRSKTALLALILALGSAARADEHVMLQGFYWDNDSGWYRRLGSQLDELQAGGITAIWLPSPVKCGAGASSNGYDPYDHYDLGEFDQKGTVATHFGTKQELIDLVKAMHDRKMAAYADMVLNHMIGADAQETNPIDQKKDWTRFDYAARKVAPAGAPTWEQVERLLGHPVPHAADEPYLFKKTFSDFHPSAEHRDQNPERHNAAFGADLCQQHDWVRVGFKLWGDWLTRTVGYDGYRLDFAKGLDDGFLDDWLNSDSMKGKFAVREYWEGDVNKLDAFYHEADSASVFDFPLFFNGLNPMCDDTSGNNFDMRTLTACGYSARNRFRTVTFAENHDTDRSNPIRTDKTMAYAFILSMEGYPCVFYKDLYVYGLKDQIFQLIGLRKRFAGGSTSVLHADRHVFVAQRDGTAATTDGLVMVLNNQAAGLVTVPVKVNKKWAGQRLWVHAFGGNVAAVSSGESGKLSGDGAFVPVGADGSASLSAPPRGYAIYAIDNAPPPPPPTPPKNPAMPPKFDLPHDQLVAEHLIKHTHPPQHAPTPARPSPVDPTRSNGMTEALGGTDPH